MKYWKWGEKKGYTLPLKMPMVGRFWGEHLDPKEKQVLCTWNFLKLHSLPLKTDNGVVSKMIQKFLWGPSSVIFLKRLKEVVSDRFRQVASEGLNPGYKCFFKCVFFWWFCCCGFESRGIGIHYHEKSLAWKNGRRDFLFGGFFPSIFYRRDEKVSSFWEFTPQKVNIDTQEYP